MTQRAFYRLLPLLLLILIIAIINLAPRWLSFPTQPTPIREQPQVTHPGAVATPTAALPTSSPPATAPPATAPPSPTATIPAEAVITLLGPPAHGRFTTPGRITFYWRWPLPLDSARRFSLYWLYEGEELLVGSLEAPNLGQQGYWLAADVSGVGTPVMGDVAWQVRLESDAGALLVGSEARPFIIGGQ